jgi:hypothetical protein
LISVKNKNDGKLFYISQKTMYNLFKPEYCEDFIKNNKCYSVINSKSKGDYTYDKCTRLASYSKELVDMYNLEQDSYIYEIKILSLGIILSVISIIAISYFARIILKAITKINKYKKLRNRIKNNKNSISIQAKLIKEINNHARYLEREIDTINSKI